MVWAERVVHSTPELQEAIAAGVTAIDADAKLRAADIIRDALVGGVTVYLLGNGEASAISAISWIDLMGACRQKSVHPVRITNLTDNLELYGTFVDSFGFELAFQKMLEASGMGAGDVVFAISSAGMPGVENALQSAKQNGARTILLSGPDTDGTIRYADVALIPPRYSFTNPDWYRLYSHAVNTAAASLICAEVCLGLGGIDATELMLPLRE